MSFFGIVARIPKHVFAEGKMLGWHPTGPEWGEFRHFSSRLAASSNIPNPNICETRVYVEFTAINMGEICRPTYLSPKSAIFSFFGFSNITFRNIHDRRILLSNKLKK